MLYRFRVQMNLFTSKIRQRFAFHIERRHLTCRMSNDRTTREVAPSTISTNQQQIKFIFSDIRRILNI